MDWLNVIDFGATGNGTTNDTAGIQAALDAAVSGSTRATVYFPRGIYRVIAPLKLHHGTGVTLRGEGNSLGTTNQIGSGYTGREVASVIFWDGIDATTEVKAIGGITSVGLLATATAPSHGMTISSQYRVSIRGAGKLGTVTYSFTSENRWLSLVSLSLSLSLCAGRAKWLMWWLRGQRARFHGELIRVPEMATSRMRCACYGQLLQSNNQNR